MSQGLLLDAAYGLRTETCLRLPRRTARQPHRTRSSGGLLGQLRGRRMMSGDVIERAIDDALRAHWIEQCRPPVSIQVNPADADNLIRSWSDRRSRDMAEIGIHWPELAAKYRREDRNAPVAGISHWVDIYAGGVAVPFIMDATVPRGEVRLGEE